MALVKTELLSLNQEQVDDVNERMESIFKIPPFGGFPQIAKDAIYSFIEFVFIDFKKEDAEEDGFIEEMFHLWELSRDPAELDALRDSVYYDNFYQFNCRVVKKFINDYYYRFKD